MKRIAFIIFTLFLIIGCAGKSQNIKSVYSPNINKSPEKTVPTFSVFKGTKPGKKIKSENIEEQKISSVIPSENVQKNKKNLPEDSYIVDGFLVKDIHFDFDSAVIRPQDIPYLEKLAEFLKDHPEYKITIEGHCDERGSEMYNLALGQRRADSVKNFLINLGISPKRIKTISYGEERPLDPRHNPIAWAKNRRCHFDLEK